MRARLVSFVAALATLGACASEGRSPGFARQALERAAALRPGQEAPSSGITLSDAQLLAFEQDLIVMEIPSRDVEAGLVRSMDNRGSVSWVTPDGVEVTFRDGQIVGTRGLGDDLLSAEVPDVRRVRGMAVRDLYHLEGDLRVVRNRFTCDVTDRGRDPVVVTGIRYEARRIEETCTAPDGVAFENLYWIQPSGVIRKSRQFVSPALGYVSVSDVHGGRRP